MANPRVSEIAKKLGIESKKAVEILNDELKEFVKSPSSTIMPPTVRKLSAYVSEHPELVKAAGADEAAGVGACAVAGAAAGVGVFWLSLILNLLLLSV